MICEGWEGLTVDGRFPLLELLGGSPDRCVFLTVRQGIQKASIKLILAGGADAGAYLAKWEVAKSFSHPYLTQVMETGRCTIKGSDLVFCLTEKTQQVLSGIIPRSALEAATLKEILDPIVDTLLFLHEKGHAHGCVKPSKIVQVDNQWKLASDEMVGVDELARSERTLDTYDAPETTAGKLSPASDLWSLGIIMVEALARRTPVWDRSANGNLGLPDWLPEPFRGIARECLRWQPADRISIAEVKARLASFRPPVTTEPVKEAAPKESSEAASMLLPGPESADSSQPEKPVPAAAGSRNPPHEEPAELTPRSHLFANLGDEEEPETRRWPLLFGLVLLAIVAPLAVHYRDVLSHFAGMQSAPAASEPSSNPQTPQAQPEQGQSAPANADQRGVQPQPQTQSQTTPESNPGAASSSAPQSQPPETQPAPAQTQPGTVAQTPATPSQGENPPAAPPASREPATSRMTNGKGAVLKRVLPNVAPGASEGIRRPVEVELRVAVNEEGRVTSAECLTQGPGNYFARIARQAAESWKFRSPEIEGQPRASQWTLRFRFERRRTDVTATELR